VLALNVPPHRIEPALADLVARGQLVVDADRLYTPALWRAETFVAAAIAERLRRTPPALDDAKAMRATEGYALNAAQNEAVRMSLRQTLLVLTGGPGTGKTTTVRALVAAHHHLARRVALAAPTGRAAKRLSEATGQDAKTLHRLLEFNPISHRFSRDASSPIEADLVLVDEASMLDLRLAEALLRALPPSAQLVWVGDVDQLPPVGAGQVLREALRCDGVPVVRLTEIFRQAQQSAIVRGAHAILHGHVPTPTPAGERGDGDLFWIRTGSAEVIAQRITETLARIPRVYGLDSKDDVQVLVPMRRGPLGTEQLNPMLQRYFHPEAAGDPEGAGLRVGDKVMQLRNDYEREVFNGDLGTVRRIESGVVFVDMASREVAYDGDALDALTLAYASTVHKVQGSEFPAVIIALHATHHLLLTRALLYTAVTRARRLAVIIGDERALRRAVRNELIYRSHTRLVERLESALAAAPARP
jgi:exodeoxyribonuclease V alpha subunit